MKVNIYNQEGKVIGETQLSGQVFNVKVVPDLLHQVVVSQMANRRQGTVKAKDRSEVAGGGRKPWRQKGTGRARHGSIRSPLWKGGGVTFGPSNVKVYKKIIPKKMKRLALFMVLSEKARNNFLVVVDDLKIAAGKTKIMAGILGKLPSHNQTTLIVLPAMDKDTILAARNIARVQTIQAKDLNALDLLNYKYLILSKESIKMIEQTFLAKSKV